MDLSDLWRFHQNAPFPASALSLSVDGVRLVKVDAEVGALLTASLRTDGVPRGLPGDRREALQKGLERVRKALAEASVDPEVRAYFSRLETLSLAVLALKG